MNKNINELSAVFKSKMKVLEVLALIEDRKRCIRQGFYEEELPAVKDFCRRQGLFLVSSPFKVVLTDESSSFSNKGEITKADDLRRGMSFAYLAKDELTALQCLYFEVKKEHKNLGILLGYPECCAEFFRQHEPIVSQCDGNYENAVLENSRGDKFAFQNNIFLRHKDLSLLSHFPCSLSCEQSKILGDVSLDIAERNFPEYATELKKNLKGKFVLHRQRIEFM